MVKLGNSVPQPFLVSPRRGYGAVHLRLGDTNESACGTHGEGYVPAQDVPAGHKMCVYCRGQLWNWLVELHGEGT